MKSKGYPFGYIERLDVDFGGFTFYLEPPFSHVSQELGSDGEAGGIAYH